MSDFMIQYITRFKIRFEYEVTQLEENPFAPASLYELQLLRARRVVDAADVILKMGPNAMEIDQEKFEDCRAVLLFSSLAYNKSQRQIRDGTVEALNRMIRPTKPMRHR